MMETFIREVIMRLENGSALEVQHEDIQDIANLSSIIASHDHQKPTHHYPETTAPVTIEHTPPQE